MIADHTVPHALLQYAGVVSAIVLLAGGAAALFRKGRVAGLSNALEVAEQERGVYEARADRLEKEMLSSKEQCAVDIARLTGIVEQLQDENARLQSLVMGETVPPALGEYIKGAAERNVENYRAILDDKLRPIMQSLDRLTTKGGEES